jgi:hypothetical protein
MIDPKRRVKKAMRRRRRLQMRAARKPTAPHTTLRPGEVTFLGEFAAAAAAWCQAEGVPHRRSADADGVDEVRLRPAALTRRQRAALPAAVLAGHEGPFYVSEVPG